MVRHRQDVGEFTTNQPSSTELVLSLPQPGLVLILGNPPCNPSQLSIRLECLGEGRALPVASLLYS